VNLARVQATRGCLGGTGKETMSKLIKGYIEKGGKEEKRRLCRDIFRDDLRT